MPNKKLIRLLALICLLAMTALQCSSLGSRWYYEPDDSRNADMGGEFPAGFLTRTPYPILASSVGSIFETRHYGPCLLPVFSLGSPAPDFRRKLNIVLIFRGGGNAAPLRLVPGDIKVKTARGVFAPKSFQILDDGGRVPSGSWGPAYYDRKQFFFGPGRIRLHYEIDTAETESFELLPRGIGEAGKGAVRFTRERDWKYTPFTPSGAWAVPCTEPFFIAGTFGLALPKAS